MSKGRLLPPLHECGGEHCFRCTRGGFETHLSCRIPHSPIYFPCMKIDRLLATTVLLLNRRKATARELADRFEVSIRTVYRDIETLNSAGIPVVSYQGYEGGFCILDNYKLNRQLLTFNDMLSILSALKGVNTTFKDRELDNAIEKISALIPDDKETEYLDYGERFVMDIMPWGYGTRQQTRIRNIHAAVSSSRLLSFSYRNAAGEASERTVEPMTLVFKPPGWYLFSFCLLKNDYRVFKLSRMKNLCLADRRFTRRDRTWREFFAPDYDKRPPVEIVLKFLPPAAATVEDWFSEEPRYEKDGSCILTLSMPDDPWVHGMILSYGDRVEVLSPPEFREKIGQTAEKIRGKYRNLTD